MAELRNTSCPDRKWRHLHIPRLPECWRKISICDPYRLTTDRPYLGNDMRYRQAGKCILYRIEIERTRVVTFFEKIQNGDRKWRQTWKRAILCSFSHFTADETTYHLRSVQKLLESRFLRCQRTWPEANRLENKGATPRWRCPISQKRPIISTSNRPSQIGVTSQVERYCRYSDERDNELCRSRTQLCAAVEPSDWSSNLGESVNFPGVSIVGMLVQEVKLSRCIGGL